MGSQTASYQPVFEVSEWAGGPAVRCGRRGEIKRYEIKRFGRWREASSAELERYAIPMERYVDGLRAAAPPYHG